MIRSRLTGGALTMQHAKRVSISIVHSPYILNRAIRSCITRCAIHFQASGYNAFSAPTKSGCAIHSSGQAELELLVRTHKAYNK
jgi:hypothetical protein